MFDFEEPPLDVEQAKSPFEPSRYALKDLVRYAKANGKQVTDLTEEEIGAFAI